uniref:Serine/threonineprotein kinase, putativelike [Tribolium castaneum] n=1 Tax=Lepeophtheirus salmonis TaxID=72036 RepID=A0A0K2T9A4_LEPSM
MIEKTSSKQSKINMMRIPLEFTSTDIIDESRLRMERYKEKKKLRKLLMKRRGLGGISVPDYDKRSASEERASSSNATPPSSPAHVINGYSSINNEIKDHIMRELQIVPKDTHSLSKFRYDITPPKCGFTPTPPSRKKKGNSFKDEEQEEGRSILIEEENCSRGTRELTLFSSSVSSTKTAFSQLSSEAFSSSSTSQSPIFENPPKRPHNDPFNNDNNNQISNSLTINDSAQNIVDEIVQLLKVATGGPQVSNSMPSPRSHASLNRTLYTSASSSRQYNYKSEIDLDSSLGSSQHEDALIRQVDFDKEFDILQKIGEGWFSRVYLSEYTPTGEELVIKMINSQKVTYEEFLQEVRYSVLLSSHKNILRIYDGLVFQAKGYFVFAAEYAPLGDLTSNVLSERGIGETATKSITKQIASALEWVHSKNLCHLDVKLDNILVFKSDFSKVKLCDFGSVRTQGDIVIKKNELLPYCPPELFARHANEYYQVDKMQDIFQFGIVIFFCLFGILPWQKADTKTDPHFGDFYSWRNKKSGGKIPKNFKPLTTKGQKFFKKILDPDPYKRLPLVEVTNYTEDKWTRLKKPHSLTGSLIPQNLITIGNFSSSTKSNIKGNQRQISRSIHSDPLKNNHILSDGFSQLTMGSFRSVHSNVDEKNKSLYPLLQAGVETTVDRTQKNSRILKWIQSSNRKPSSDPSEVDPDSKKGDKSEVEGHSRFLRGVYESNQIEKN